MGVEIYYFIYFLIVLNIFTTNTYYYYYQKNTHKRFLIWTILYNTDSLGHCIDSLYLW